MSQEQPHRPVTYGDVFPTVQGELASQAVAPRDAALMQSVESVGLGEVPKGGPAAMMQAASARNLKEGLADTGSTMTSRLADAGVAVVETVHMGGDVVHSEYIAGQPVAVSVEKTPVAASLLLAQEAVTIGEALETAAIGAGDVPIEPSDARAIQSAEMRATGVPISGGGGLASAAQSAADVNPRVENQAKTTLGDVLMDASMKLPIDKVVTKEDAERIEAVEMRSRPSGDIRSGGVAAAVRAAADYNEDIGVTGTATGIQQLNVKNLGPTL